MKFPDTLIEARLVRRYKRFLADVILADGTELTVHCPNTGAMTGCAEPGSRVWLLDSGNPKRKYRHTWELVETVDGELACVHSARANALFAEALAEGRVPGLMQVADIRREVAYGGEGSRADFQLQSEGRTCTVEVKSVTLHPGDGLGVFPDAVSQRAARHLRELVAECEAGRRGILVFVAQHTGVRRVAPADSIDPHYAETLREALAAGVEMVALGCSISPAEIAISRALPVLDRQP